MTNEPNNLPGAACLPLAGPPHPPDLTPTVAHLWQIPEDLLNPGPWFLPVRDAARGLDAQAHEHRRKAYDQ